jgi:hypothetical protein
LNDQVKFFYFTSEFGSGSVQLYSLVLQEAVKSIFFRSECSYLAFVVGFGSFKFFLLSLVLNVAILEFFFVPNDKVFILMNLSFKFGLAIDNLIFLIISHLVSFNGEILHFSGSVVDNLLQFADLSIE